ncbi:hypothetical protein ACLOJK_011759 [Asimina triloba]
MSGRCHFHAISLPFSATPHTFHRASDVRKGLWSSEIYRLIGEALRKGLWSSEIGGTSQSLLFLYLTIRFNGSGTDFKENVTNANFKLHASPALDIRTTSIRRSQDTTIPAIAAGKSDLGDRMSDPGNSVAASIA